MQVNQSVAQGMLRNISDPALRETYGNILSGKYRFLVYCLDPRTNPETGKPFHKAGALIGYVTKTNKVIDNPTQNKAGLPVAGIETSRDRFDGRKGFRCYCGNWSIQADEEKGVLKQSRFPTPPTQDDLFKIHENLQKSGKGPLQFINGRAEYDGFALEEAKS